MAAIFDCGTLATLPLGAEEWLRSLTVGLSLLFLLVPKNGCDL